MIENINEFTNMGKYAIQIKCEQWKFICNTVKYHKLLNFILANKKQTNLVFQNNTYRLTRNFLQLTNNLTNTLYKITHVVQVTSWQNINILWFIMSNNYVHYYKSS